MCAGAQVYFGIPERLVEGLLCSALPFYGKVCRSFAIGVVCFGPRLPPPNPLVHKNAKIPTRVLASATPNHIGCCGDLPDLPAFNGLECDLLQFHCFSPDTNEMHTLLPNGVGDFNTLCLGDSRFYQRKKMPQAYLLGPGPAFLLLSPCCRDRAGRPDYSDTSPSCYTCMHAPVDEMVSK